MGKNAFFIIVLFLSLSSCNKNEVVYSCDNDVNDWVYENLDNIASMTRSEWKSLDDEYKIPVFRAFTQEQRVLFWNEKINDIISGYDWNVEEHKHIVELLNFINNNVDIFDFSTEYSDEQIERIEVFSYKWIENALNELGWDLPLIKAIVASGDDIGSNSETGNVELRNPKCNCNTESWVEWCITTHCDGGNCLESNHGCAFLLVGECNGSC